MVGLTRLSAIDRGIEAALRGDRTVALGGLAALVLLAWVYLWHEAAMMDAATTEVALPHATDAAILALTFLMWAVMMVAMMLPSAAPTILMYGALVRKNGERGTVLPALWIFTSAYLLVWTAFSVAATLLQWILERMSLLTPEMTSSNTALSGLALIVAGVYQLTPLKQTCLGKCRNPLEFLVTRWRAGTGGAFRMGLEHGLYCVGCCWALMLLLFVAGVMNLVWVALIAGFVLVEKLLPAVRGVSFATSLALILAGGWLLVSG